MLKQLFDQGHDFEKFKCEDDGQHVDKVETFLNLSSEAVTDVLKTKILAVESANIVVFAEVWCPDCMINVAALEVIHQLNSNIKYSIVTRSGHEEELKSITPDHSAKIPTFVSVDDKWAKKGLFLEKPKVVRDVESGDDQVQRIVVKRDYRNGKYLLSAMEEIIELL